MPRKALPRIIRKLWLLTLVSVLPACAPLEPLPPARTAPLPVAVAVEYRHEVQFQAGRADVSAVEAAGLRRFVASIPSDRVRAARVGGPAGSRVGDTYADLSGQRAARVAELLRSFSAAELDVTIQPFGERRAVDPASGGRARPREDRVVVTISGAEPVLPGCPDWSRDPGFDPGNFPLSNLGCANAYNLGLMVADPKDLSQPRSLAAADGTREADSIVRYRSDKVKQLIVDVIP